MQKIIIFTVLLCIAGSSAFADIIVMADQSCRTEGGVRADENRHDSSKLSVRRTSSGNKSWIKFDISELALGELDSAILTVSLHEGKGGNQSFDVSFVNDDCVDNIDWDDRSITWNNAPGNDITVLDLLDATKTTFLETVNFTDAFTGDSFTIDILEAIQTDTDGIVQFVLHNSDGLLNFSTHDHSVETQRPFIDITERHIGANDPDPDDATSVETILPGLSWLNPDPNDPLGSIVCDVYFGTEPNRPEMDMITLGVDASSVEISAANFPNFAPLANKTTYYWIVDCHDDSRDDELMPGLIWSFYTDDNQPPVVDLGDDVVAWLGMSGTPDEETIELVPLLVSDDGIPGGALTVEWTQVDNGAPAAIINSVNAEATSVTVTSADVYEFMLVANDGVKEGSDTIQVVVGTNACDASHMNTGDAYNDADQNEDCIVDLADFAVLFVANWLDCTDSLTNCGN